MSSTKKEADLEVLVQAENRRRRLRAFGLTVEQQRREAEHLGLSLLAIRQKVTKTDTSSEARS